jgi:hypothetical protein
MIKQYFDDLKKRRSDESGVALVEAMVAAIIILIVLVATAVGMTSSFSASTSSENRNKAMQMVNNEMAIAKQAPYAQLGITAPTTNSQQAGCSPYSSTFNGEAFNAISNPFSGLVYCQPEQYSNVGITFYVETQITWVQSNTYDGSSQPVNIDGLYYTPKRITVTVRWAESADSAGNAITQNIAVSEIRTPNTTECIPPGLNSGPAPLGCNPS